MTEKSEINFENLPAHIGIIMDGNGRWAKGRKKPRTFGHNEGLKAAKRVVKAASDIGIKYLTLYVFSTENWKRAESEVSFLMSLIKKNLVKEFNFYQKNKIRIFHSGNWDKLPLDVRQSLQKAIDDTKNFNGLSVVFAINYGGRDEIIRAVEKYLQSGKNKNKLSEDVLKEYLDNPCVPEPDLIIRTGGEHRISNFLLWESAYSELFFSNKLWPEWGRDELVESIVSYQKRSRRFGSA